ncbi:hypothetical protein AB1Y20_019906 [Prymnesium parvum]|uniref:Uncharacterized protein n=1 Tax=Prymnesium parvum TaxID=97485 RepID=A0AB34JS91_PRYPA
MESSVEVGAPQLRQAGPSSELLQSSQNSLPGPPDAFSTALSPASEAPRSSTSSHSSPRLAASSSGWGAMIVS